MSASSAPRTVVSRTVRTARGYRVIRAVRQAAAEAPGSGLSEGLFGRFWLRLCAVWPSTPEQCHARHLARQTGADGGDLRGRAVLLGERTLLLASPDRAASSRRHPQGDRP